MIHFKELEDKAKYLKERPPFYLDEDIIEQEQYCLHCHQIFAVKDFKLRIEQRYRIRIEGDRYVGLMPFDDKFTNRYHLIEGSFGAYSTDTRKKAETLAKKLSVKLGYDNFEIMLHETDVPFCANAPECDGTIMHWTPLSWASAKVLDAALDKAVAIEQYERAAMIKAAKEEGERMSEDEKTEKANFSRYFDENKPIKKINTDELD